MDVPRHLNSILMVCRIEKDKGIQYMVRAMPEVLKSISDITLIVVGDGSYKSVIQKLIDDLFLHDCVNLTGTVPLEQLPEIYNSHTIFVNSTIRQNGYDLSIIEAMSCGRPVVCTNIGSIPTLITNNVNGIFVKKKDISKLASVVISLFKDEKKCRTLGDSARKTILESFTNEEMVDKTIDVYQEVIRNYKY